MVAAIEPEDNEWSRGALDHYRRMLACCSSTMSSPRHVPSFHDAALARARGGGGSRDRRPFSARSGAVGRRARDLIGMGCTINEPNVVSVLGYISAEFPPACGLRGRSAGQRAFDCRAPQGVRTDQGGRGDFPLGHALDERLVGPEGSR